MRTDPDGSNCTDTLTTFFLKILPGETTIANVYKNPNGGPLGALGETKKKKVFQTKKSYAELSLNWLREAISNDAASFVISVSVCFIDIEDNSPFSCML